VAARKLTAAAVKRAFLAVPGMAEGKAWHHDVFRHNGKIIGRVLEDGQSVMIKLSFETREHLVRADPKTFYITDHYKNFPAVLARLERLSTADLKALLARAIEQASTKRKRTSPRP